jgi:DNA-binding MarR family transcriptional regulator
MLRPRSLYRRPAAYRENRHHQRARLVAVTPAGQAALASIDAAQRQWCDAPGPAAGETSLRQTAAGLRRLADVVDAGQPG